MCRTGRLPYVTLLTLMQRGETDFFSGEPLNALTTLVFSDNVDLQRSASLTFAEITERGAFPLSLEVEDAFVRTGFTKMQAGLHVEL